MDEQYLLTYCVDGVHLAELCSADEVSRHIAEYGENSEYDFRVYEFVSGRPSRLFPNYTPDLTHLELRNSGYEPVIIIELKH